MLVRLRTMNPYRAGAVLLAVAAGGFALYNARHGYFQSDGWAYWTTRRGLLDAGGKKNLFDFFFLPHNGHVQALVWAAWLPLDWLFGMHRYIPYLLPTVTIQVMAGWLLFELLVDELRPAIALAAAGLFLFAGNAAGVVALAFTLGETAPIFGAFLALLAVARFEARNERLMVVLTVGAMLFALSAASGIGVVVAVTVISAYLLRRRYGWAALHAVIAAVPYLMLWLRSFWPPPEVWQREFIPPGSSFDLGRVGDYLSYIWDGLTTTTEDLVGVPVTAVGAVVLGAAILGAFWSWRDGDRLAFVYVSALTGAIFFYLAVALRAIDRDPRAYSADQLRYLYIAGSLLLPSLAALSNRLISWRRWTAIPLAALLIWAIPINVRHQADGATAIAAVGRANRVSIESTASIIGLLDAAPDGIPVADFTIRIPVAQFERLDRQGKVPCNEDFEAAADSSERIGIPTPAPGDISCER